MPFLDLNDWDLYYEELGSGTPIVLTAGGMDPAVSMRPLALRLAAEHRVILWDRANQGQSAVVCDGASELDIAAGQLASLLDHLGCGPAFLAAPSEGTRVSMRVALRFPEHVAGMVLWQVSAGPIAEHLRQTNYEQYAALAEESGMDAVAATPWYHERIKFNPHNRERLLAANPLKFAASRRAWRDELREEDPVLGHSAAEVATVTAPTLVVEGVDWTHPAEASARLAELLPSGEHAAAPYDEALWNSIVSAPPGGIPFALYALMPGIYELIREFIRRHSDTL
jgi:pimeloyl-ACP methyl ester carboxylesterase